MFNFYVQQQSLWHDVNRTLRRPTNYCIYLWRLLRVTSRERVSFMGAWTSSSKISSSKKIVGKFKYCLIYLYCSNLRLATAINFQWFTTVLHIRFVCYYIDFYGFTLILPYMNISSLRFITVENCILVENSKTWMVQDQNSIILK